MNDTVKAFVLPLAAALIAGLIQAKAAEAKLDTAVSFMRDTLDDHARRIGQLEAKR